LEKNEPGKRDPLGGCGVYRQGLVISSLQKRLAKAETEEERERIRAEIEALEKEMGF